jgi:hypothetical protein
MLDVSAATVAMKSRPSAMDSHAINLQLKGTPTTVMVEEEVNNSGADQGTIAERGEPNARRAWPMRSMQLNYNRTTQARHIDPLPRWIEGWRRAEESANVEMQWPVTGRGVLSGR